MSDTMETPEQTITVTIKDTVTGETCVVPGWSEFWWAEGNGSCDCNRVIFLKGHDGYEAYRKSIGKPENVCLGAKRFIIINAEGTDLPLAELNADYDAALRERDAQWQQRLRK